MTTQVIDGLDMSKVFNKLIEKHPNPALLCYYFFLPAHIESLAPPCDDTEAGKEFARFAGEWACKRFCWTDKLTINLTGAVDRLYRPSQSRLKAGTR